MNKAVLIGRLTRDPEVRYSQGENSTAVASFTLAVDRSYKKEGSQEADFIRCTSFGKNAEFIEKYVKKGTKLAIEGHIQTGSYQDKDGKTVYTTDVIVERSEFCEKKSDGEATYNPADIPANIDDEIPFV